MKHIAFITFLFIAFPILLFGQKKGYAIDIKIDNFSEKECYFGFHMGDGKYIKDTLAIQPNGHFLAKGEEALEGGIYLVILPPDNNYFEVFIPSPEEQQFSVTTDIADLIGKMEFKGSPENVRFYEYLNFVTAQRKASEDIRKSVEGEEDQKKKDKAQEKLTEINDNVVAYQQKIINQHSKTLAASVIKASLEPEVPSPNKKMTEEEEGDWRFRYYKAHFFDNINFADARLIRTPIYQGRLDRYMDKMNVQHPDSLIQQVDYVLEKASASEELFKFTLIHLLNKYASSKIVGLDAVYVHLGEHYYGKGKAPWTEEEQLKKILKNVKDLKPLLIGKKAPNISIKRVDNQEQIQLYNVNSPYTVVYFWDPKCGHCNKVAPVMVEFYNKYKDKGVEIFSICTKDKKLGECQEAVKEKAFTPWINTVAIDDTDLYYRFYYKIKTTPVVYVLDKDKTIVSKGIGVEQLGEVMDMLFEQAKEK